MSLPTFENLVQMQQFAKKEGLAIDKPPRDSTVPRLRSRLALGSRAAGARVRSHGP